MALSIPGYTYTGTHSSSSDNTYWYITLKTSGTLKFTNANHTVDVFLVGGGGGGSPGGGGGGGYTTTKKSISATKGTGYAAVIGAGGAPQTVTGSTGGTTSMFSVTAGGGLGGNTVPYYDANDGHGGNGGSGGGAGWRDNHQFNGGTNGGDGGTNMPYYAPQVPQGKGQGTTTKPFGEDTSSGIPYSGGGGGASSNNITPAVGGYYGGGKAIGLNTGAAESGIANSGGGAGACGTSSTSAQGWTYGGSGLIIIRGKTTDGLPIIYNGTRIISLKFVNGTAAAVDVNSVVYNGTKLF